MKYSFFFLFFLVASLSTAYSQENNEPQTYRVSLSDLKMTSYSKDSTANALVLYEYGKSFVHSKDFDLRTEVKHKIKILNREGFDNANVLIHLYNRKNRKEKVKDILATTYNLVDGKVVITKLQEKDIFREKYDKNHILVKFTLPNIKEGSIVIYSYKLISPFMFKYKGWNFQGHIPKLYSEYKTSIPGNWLYHIKLVGGEKLTINDSEIKKSCLEMGNGSSADCSNSIYAMKDIPAFIEEDYMTTEDNYLARIEYELETFRGMDGTVKHYTKTWDDVDKELKIDKEIGKQLKKKLDIESLLSNNIINETDILNKAKTIYHYVQNNYAWNEEYKIFNDVSIKNLLKNKSGNVSSINILLHNLLKEVGVSVKPILISTRNNGFPTTIFPVLSDFNYQIVQAEIDGKTYLLDATDDYLSFGELPFRCLNSQGRLLDFKKGSEWIDIKSNEVSSIQYMVELDLDEDQNFLGKVSSRATGYHALDKRKNYYKNNDNYIENIKNSNPHIEIQDHSVTSKGKNSLGFSENYNVRYNSENTGDNIYLNPFLVKFFSENPFKLQERTYPIDFGYKKHYLYFLKLNLGDTYTVLEKPKDLNLLLPNNKGQLNFSTNVLGNTLNVLIKFNLNEPIYSPEYYPYLKEFISKVIDIQTNSLILLKKK